MNLYQYLLDKHKKTIIYGPESRWEKFCVWALFSVFGAKYWHETAVVNEAKYKRIINENERYYQKKLDRYRNAYIKVVELSNYEYLNYKAIDPLECFYNEAYEVVTDKDMGALEMSDEAFLNALTKQK